MKPGRCLVLALLLAHPLLAGAADPRRAAVLVSDGLFTYGPDPRPLASRFGALHVLRTAGDPMPSGVWLNPVRQAGADLATLGGGRLVPVAAFPDLPRRMLELAEAILRFADLRKRRSQLAAGAGFPRHLERLS